MRKIAVFVEGQSEQIIIREFLLRHFNWQVDLSCLVLYQKGEFKPCQYPNQFPEAEFHYSIYNVGGDVEVLDEILLYENHLWEEGFERIIGLRDMYSKNYRSLSTTIDAEINLKFIKGHTTTISKKAKIPKQIYFCFSII